MTKPEYLYLLIDMIYVYNPTLQLFIDWSYLILNSKLAKFIFALSYIPCQTLLTFLKTKTKKNSLKNNKHQE